MRNVTVRRPAIAAATAASATLIMTIVLASQLSAAGQDPLPASEPLYMDMDRVDEAYRALRKQIDDPSKDEDSIRLVCEMQKHALVAKGKEPPIVEAMSGDEKARTLNGFRIAVAGALREMIDLEIDLREGRREKAIERIAALNELKKNGHNLYQE